MTWHLVVCSVLISTEIRCSIRVINIFIHERSRYLAMSVWEMHNRLRIHTEHNGMAYGQRKNATNMNKNMLILFMARNDSSLL